MPNGFKQLNVNPLVSVTELPPISWTREMGGFLCVWIVG